MGECRESSRETTTPPPYLLRTLSIEYLGILEGVCVLWVVIHILTIFLPLLLPRVLLPTLSLGAQRRGTLATSKRGQTQQPYTSPHQ
jgi:hypothetical protein